jgi:hypothetical protein
LQGASRWWRGSPRSAAVAPPRAETPALARDSGLGVSPWHSSMSDEPDAHPESGRRLYVSSRRLRVGRLRLETPVPRGRRLRSVWLDSGQLRLQSRVGPETLVPGRRLQCWSHLGRRLRPSRLETPALVGQQRLHFMEDYIKPSSTSRRGRGFHFLSSIVAKLQSPRSLSLATRTQSPFGI